jgi:hypothetical protein
MNPFPCGSLTFNACFSLFIKVVMKCDGVWQHLGCRKRICTCRNQNVENKITEKLHVEIANQKPFLYLSIKYFPPITSLSLAALILSKKREKKRGRKS